MVATIFPSRRRETLVGISLSNSSMALSARYSCQKVKVALMITAARMA